MKPLRAANAVEGEERTTLLAGSVSTASCFQMKSLENSFASPKCRSGGAIDTEQCKTSNNNYVENFNVLVSTMEFGREKRVSKVFSLCLDNTAMSVLASFPGSFATRDKSSTSPLTPINIIRVVLLYTTFCI